MLPCSHSVLLAMTELKLGVVDVYIISPTPGPWQILVLQRADDTRCPRAWESVHGTIEPAERPEDAALRELREETGLNAERLYNVTTHAFYLHASNTVQLAIVFAAFVGASPAVSLGEEHQRFEWLSVDEAAERFAWPREREALRHITTLLGRGDAGPLEDVLRVR
jgi:dATP pyrophosphohydrolase